MTWTAATAAILVLTVNCFVLCNLPTNPGFEQSALLCAASDDEFLHNLDYDDDTGNFLLT